MTTPLTPQLTRDEIVALIKDWSQGVDVSSGDDYSRGNRDALRTLLDEIEDQERARALTLDNRTESS
jgi:hypothetical protein